MVLFGSYAKGNYTVAIDIDLLVVYEGARQEGAFATVKEVAELSQLEPHPYTEAEYQRTPVIQQMIKGG